MSATPGHRKQQVIEHVEAIPLADLMEPASLLETDYEVIESEKPKRKRKPKPQSYLQIPYSVVVGVVALLIGFIVAAMIALVPVAVNSSESVIVSQPIEEASQIEPNIIPSEPDALVDRWMILDEQIGEIPANTFVRILSRDDSPDFYNVADLEGHLTIVHTRALREGTNAPSVDAYPPLGPYSTTLSSNQKLLITTEWNGDMKPGTRVYAMGWRAEDGTWIYQVSPDRVKIYYLPSIHLKWADGSK